MPVNPGAFCWYELITADPQAAARFYGEVVGWRMQPSDMPGVVYTVAQAGERPVAGIMGFPPEMAEARPGWRGYVLVEDVDATAARVAAAGGTVHRPPADIPGVGRFAVVSDPQRAPFTLFRGTGPAPADLAPGAPGGVGWHELHATDWQAAWSFYSGLFGWEKTEAVDMGPMGLYQTFMAGGASGGGMMTRADAATGSWLYYFNVDDIDAAVTRVNGAGGTVRHGPMEVPGGSRILQATDPQGVAFALVEPKT